MFKKKPHFKSLAPLRSSDRRKLVDQIIKQYHLTAPEESSEGKDESASSGIGAFRNSILPDGALSANFTTTTGPDLKTVKGTVYVGASSDSQQRIFWIKLDDGQIIPSVYSLWRHPQIVPLLHTPDIVIQKMREGADLNTPGLARGPPFPSGATKGAIVAVASYEVPSVPLVVGVCEIDVSALTEVRGQKGHAVRPLHWDGDEVWSWCNLGQGGEAAPQDLEAWYQQKQEAQVLVDKAGELSINEDGWAQGVSSASAEHHADDGTLPAPAREWTTQEVDMAFRNAFLYSLHKARNDVRGEPNHGMQFPISQSQFISTLITPYLPTHTPEDTAALQIKKTSWKNVKKFIKTLDKEMLLKSKDRNGGETVVLDVDFEDQAILSFTPYRLPKKDTPAHGSDASTSAKSGATDSSIGQTLQRLTLLKPKEKLRPVFGTSAAGQLYLSQEIKPIVTRYIEEESLIDAGNKRMVNLNPILANGVFDSGASLDNEILSKGLVARDTLIEKIVSSCSPYWIILRNDEVRENSKAKAGKPPTVKINLETRSGNKTATRVSGLETYHIHAQALADELQKACASSTSVTQVHGSSPKNPLMEVMVQGPQKEAVLKALNRRGIRKEWVETIDKTKGKKK